MLMGNSSGLFDRAGCHNAQSRTFAPVLPFATEQSVFTSQDTLAQTKRDVALQLVALYKAVGGGWEAAATTQEASAGGS